MIGLSSVYSLALNQYTLTFSGISLLFLGSREYELSTGGAVAGTVTGPNVEQIISLL